MRRAFLGPFGILGDRRHAVVDAEGNPLTARRAHALLGFRASCEDAEAGEGVEVTTPEGWDLPVGRPGPSPTRSGARSAIRCAWRAAPWASTTPPRSTC